MEQPMISYVTTSDKTRRYNESKKRKQAQSNGQCIVKFNPSTFCNLIDVYGITESQIERKEVDSEDDGDDDETETENENGDDDDDDESEPESQPPRRNRG